MPRIRYGIDRNTRTVVSQVGREIAFSVLDYENMTPDNNFNGQYFLQKESVLSMAWYMPNIKWTKQIPLSEKNRHRKFWGMDILNRPPNDDELTASWRGFRFSTDGHEFIVVKVVQNPKTPEQTTVVLKDQKGIESVWDFEGMKEYALNYPDSVQHKTAGFIEEQIKKLAKNYVR